MDTTKLVDLHMVYAKSGEMKRFQPVNMKEGYTTRCKLRASMCSREQAFEYKEQAEKLNTNWLFEVRKV